MAVYLGGVISLSSMGIILPHSLWAQQPNYSRLDQFYSEEITRFSRDFEKHVEQLDSCIDEMSRFENGEVLLEPIRCPGFFQLHTKTSGLMDEVEIVIGDYKEAVQQVVIAGSSRDIFDITHFALSRAMSLMRIYKVKLQKAHVQNKRVQQHEMEIFDRLKSLEQRFEALRQGRDLKTAGKKRRK